MSHIGVCANPSVSGVGNLCPMFSSSRQGILVCAPGRKRKSLLHVLICIFPEKRAGLVRASCLPPLRPRGRCILSRLYFGVPWSHALYRPHSHSSPDLVARPRGAIPARTRRVPRSRAGRGLGVEVKDTPTLGTQNSPRARDRNQTGSQIIRGVERLGPESWPRAESQGSGGGGGGAGRDGEPIKARPERGRAERWSATATRQDAGPGMAKRGTAVSRNRQPQLRCWHPWT